MKIVGHDLESVSDTDQLIFIEGIAKYKQGTRRVSTQIFQRYIAWGIKQGFFDCENLIKGRQEDIIGKNTPPSYQYIPKSTMRRFFQKLKTPEYRMAFSLIYYGGLTVPELSTLTVDNVTSEGVFVYRDVRRESQMIPFPDRMMKELHDYAATREGSLFNLGEDQRARSYINNWFRSAQVETGELLGTTVRDLRTSGIRHFFELSNDLEQTREFAGVHGMKKGWLESLVDTSTHYMRNINKARSYHGSAEE